MSGLHTRFPSGSTGPAPTPKDPVDSDDSSEEEEVGRKEYSGEIEIPNLSEENDVDEIDVCMNDSITGKKVQYSPIPIHPLT